MQECIRDVLNKLLKGITPMSTQDRDDQIRRYLASLSRQIEELARRVEALESQRVSYTETSEHGVPMAPGLPPPAPIVSVPPPPRPLTPAAQPPPSPEGPSRVSSWERLIGEKWALWLGILAVFLAAAWFLANAWGKLSDEGKLSIGFLAGVLFVAGGVASRARAGRWFSEGLMGGGLALIYLSIWAGAQRYMLIGFESAFVLMAITSALGAILGVRYDAISLVLLAMAGGFLTPAVLSSGTAGGAQAVPLLVYVAILDAGMVAVSFYKRWRSLLLLCFSATILLVGGWADASYVESMRSLVFAFCTLYFLLFLGSACCYSLVRGEETHAGDLLLLFSDGVAYGIVGQILLAKPLGAYPGLFPVILAAAFLALAAGVRQIAPANIPLRFSLGGLAIVFITVAIPIQLREGWIAIAWSIEAAVLVTLGGSLSASLLMRCGQIVWGLSLVAVFAMLAEAQPVPHALFINQRALPLVAGVLCSAWMAAYTHLRRPGWLDELSPAYGVAAMFGGAWLLAQETQLGFLWYAGRTLWETSALFAIAGIEVLFGTLGFWGGIGLRGVSMRQLTYSLRHRALGSLRAGADWHAGVDAVPEPESGVVSCCFG